VRVIVRSNLTIAEIAFHMDELIKMRFPSQVLLLGHCTEALKAVEGRRILVVGSVRSARVVDWASLFTDRALCVFDGSLPHSPEATLTACVDLAREFSPDTLIAVGSGSAIDLAKAVLDSISAEFIAIPTSLGGGEMTNAYGIRTPRGTKEGRGGARYLASKVVYDPALLATIPRRELAASGINSFAHCVEAFYSVREHWTGKAAAVQGGRLWQALLPQSQEQPLTVSLGARLFEAASLAGFAINACGLGLHHAACHVIGGATGLTHGLINAVALPKTLAMNRRIAPEAVAATEKAMLIGDLVEYADALVRQLGLPGSLRELGVSEALVAPLSDSLLTAHHLRNNPGVLRADQARELMQSMFG
jgi:maleylacetate reductase